MNKFRPITFALYPNPLGFGFVCYESPRDLIDYGIVNVSPINNTKIFKRAKHLLDYYRPTLVILQDYNSKYSNYGGRVRRFIDKMVAYCKENKIAVKQYSREQIRDVFQIFGAKTKYEIAQAILLEFTVLKHKAPKPRKPWEDEDYNMGIFDALSLALTHSYLND